MASTTNSSTNTKGILLAGGLGLIAGLLFAPKSGQETMKDAKKAKERASHKLRNLASRTKEKASEVGESAKEASEEANEALKAKLDAETKQS